MWNKIKEFLKVAWKRITSSKVAWMAVPAAIAQVWMAFSGVDIAPTLNGLFEAFWGLLLLFLTLNNPDTQKKF
jgi:hypothetical protein